jgi:hypothetical protein
MKLSETDAAFWDLVGPFFYCDDSISFWSFDKKKNMFVLSCPGEKTYVPLSHMDQILKENADYIKKSWKTGNNFDGVLEIS